MTTLHIVRQSAFNSNDFAQCLQVIANDDVITFIDDGCYNLQHKLTQHIDSNKNIKLTVIKHHAQARAITVDEALFTAISMDDLVMLTFDNDRVITWQ